MYYNKWELSITDNGPSLFLDISDKEDREETEGYPVIVLPNFSFVYFPRKDEETNEKYKEILLSTNIRKIETEINALHKIRRELLVLQIND